MSRVVQQLAAQAGFKVWKDGRICAADGHMAGEAGASLHKYTELLLLCAFADPEAFLYTVKRTPPGKQPTWAEYAALGYAASEDEELIRTVPLFREFSLEDDDD